MNQCAARPSVHYFAAELVLDMDRENAIRLLEALMAAGKHSAPMAKAWIKKRAWEIGLEGQELVSALAYAGNEGWITDGPREGWISLTSKGACAISCAERSDDNSGYPPTARAANVPAAFAESPRAFSF